MNTPTPEEIERGMAVLDKERKEQAVLDLVDGYIKTADFILGLKTYGLPNDEVTMALSEIDSLFVLALRRMA
ncbi:hypothetical protein OG497_38180 [Streptomyces sp. NBC_01242]|uniref:hypothetical protein n=1 Tax=Streptomyces sp. NBC_01242 TaxID=2903795 RepID=UPI0022546AEE|nr:hypothetical protein [Streptomyces sp. NBC_01242]MCX4799689.1 hypothetical protein [Streptomyces sp. NBC_01242]